MMHSYDLFRKHIRQVIQSTRFSIVTALCEVWDFYIVQQTSFTNGHVQNSFTIVLAL